MNDLLFPSSMLAAFIIASFVLAVTPGLGVFYIVTHSLVQGQRSGLASVAAPLNYNMTGVRSSA